MLGPHSLVRPIDRSPILPFSLSYPFANHTRVCSLVRRYAYSPDIASQFLKPLRFGEYCLKSYNNATKTQMDKFCLYFQFYTPWIDSLDCGHYPLNPEKHRVIYESLQDRELWRRAVPICALFVVRVDDLQLYLPNAWGDLQESVLSGVDPLFKGDFANHNEVRLSSSTFDLPRTLPLLPPPTPPYISGA